MIFELCIFFIAVCCSHELVSQRPAAREATEFQLGAQVITKKGKWNILNTLEYFKQQRDKQLTLETTVAYGFTESLGAELTIPAFLHNKSDGLTSRGISDIITSLEYIFFNKGENTALVQGGVQWPTGNPNKDPQTGIGTFNAVLEFAAFHASTWYFGVDIDAFLTTQRKGRKPGSNYAWELRFGKIMELCKDTKLTINLDMDAFYARHDKNFGIVDPDSGGTYVLLGPLLALEYGDILLEFLFQWPIAQNLFGDQSRIEYTTYISLNVTF